MPTPKLALALKYLTAPHARKRLGLSRYQLEHRIELGIFPKPTFTDTTGVKFFDENWIRVAQTILDNAIQVNEKATGGEPVA